MGKSNACDKLFPNFYKHFSKVLGDLGSLRVLGPQGSSRVLGPYFPVCLLFATSQIHFIFYSKFYNQIDGVAMGSVLAPVLANIFMGFHKSKWLLMDIILTNQKFI